MTDTELLEMAGTAIRHGVLNVYEGRSDADMQRLVDKMLNDPAAYYTVAPLYPALRDMPSSGSAWPRSPAAPPSRR